jgi:hypothetical protein
MHAILLYHDEHLSNFIRLNSVDSRQSSVIHSMPAGGGGGIQASVLSLTLTNRCTVHYIHRKEILEQVSSRNGILTTGRTTSSGKVQRLQLCSSCAHCHYAYKLWCLPLPSNIQLSYNVSF